MERSRRRATKENVERGRVSQSYVYRGNDICSIIVIHTYILCVYIDREICRW